MNITIIGAGIAGLTTAIALKNTGHQVRIFEAAQTIKPVGAGLVLAANAIKGLYKLGIANEVINAGRLVPSFSIYDQKKNIITASDSKKLSQKYGLDNFTIHRADLHRILLTNLEPSIISTAKAAIDCTKTSTGITVHFSDGSSHDTDALIVADGIHSSIRRKLVPASVPRYAGYTCWRAVIDDKNTGINDAFETWGTRGRFGVAPLANDLLYWFACVNAPAGSAACKNFKGKDLQEIFKDFHKPVPGIIARTPDASLIHNDIIDLEPLSNYAFDNILLIGDAAHATTPNMGQGACQAIEDSVVLGEEFRKKGSLEEVFQRFEKRRLERTHFITVQSYRIGKIAQISNPFLASLRNNLFRILPKSIEERRIEKLYKTDF